MYRFLKVARVLVAVFFLLVFTWSFLDFRDSVPSGIRESALYVQFVPSFINFMRFLTFASLGFIAIIVLTFLFGRVYCSAICPLGIMQDVVIRISRRFKKRKIFRYKKPEFIFRYSLLALTVILLLLGSITALTYLDPYSNFGRILTYLLKPAVVEGNNLASGLFESAGIYSVYPVKNFLAPVMVLVWPALIFLLLMYFSIRRGRLFCNTVCPVGAFLGLISKISAGKIRFKESECNNCAACVKSCKAECIDLKTKKVDYSRCVMCFNCLDNCDNKALTLLPVKKEKEDTDIGKRKFIAASISGIFAAKATAQNHGHREERQAEVSQMYFDRKTVSPPGSLSHTHLKNACTACSLCVSACPTQVIQPAYLSYGLAGLMQPRMDFNVGFCNYDCVKCGEVCPTGAILPFLIKEKKTIQTGIAEFYKCLCVVETEGTDCGACSEHCPTKAVNMVPFGELFIPEVNPDICIGCGACEYACPVEPAKAIFVVGNVVHEKADEPEIEEIEPVDLEEDFPF